jgi:ribosomal protein L37AE/L43A
MDLHIDEHLFSIIFRCLLSMRHYEKCSNFVLFSFPRRNLLALAARTRRRLISYRQCTTCTRSIMLHSIPGIWRCHLCRTRISLFMSSVISGEIVHQELSRYDTVSVQCSRARNCLLLEISLLSCHVIWFHALALFSHLFLRRPTSSS